jgi:hypothetical protein
MSEFLKRGIKKVLAQDKNVFTLVPMHHKNRSVNLLLIREKLKDRKIKPAIQTILKNTNSLTKFQNKNIFEIIF